MPLIAYAAVAALSAGSAAVAANQQKVAANKARDAAMVDSNALNDKVKAITTQNAIDSQNLFKQLNPEAFAAGRAGAAGLAPALGQGNDLYAQLRARLGDGAHSKLLDQAVGKAGQDLALGGRLDADTQNAVIRAALARSGGVGGGGLGLGRDIAARDLGLASLGLQKDRLSMASAIGGQDIQNEQFNANNYLNQFNALGSLNSQNFGQYLAAARFGQDAQNQGPQIGLSGSSVANIQVGNQQADATRATNIGNANAGLTMALGKAAGQAVGGYYASGGFGGPSAYTTNPYATYNPSNPYQFTGNGGKYGIFSSGKTFGT